MRQRWPYLTTATVLSSPTISDLVRIVQHSKTESSAVEVVTPRTGDDSLLYWFTRKPLARLRLVLMHDMGGTATDFAQFDRLAPPEIEVVAINLPGHRNRPRGAYFKDVPALTEAFVKEAVPLLADKPMAIFGQCMGGHVAYEIALAVLKQDRYSHSAIDLIGSGDSHSDRRSPVRLQALAVGGTPAPCSAAAFKRSIAGSAPTDEEIRKLFDGPARVGTGGSQEKHALFLNALCEWYSGDLRADHAMFRSTLERYTDPSAPEPAALGVPLIACLGRRDETLKPEEVAGWHRVAGADFEFKIVQEGSHILFAEAPFIKWLNGRLLAL